MKKLIACFVLENGKYVEVPVEAVIENGKFKDEFAGRFFYPFNQYLLEMSKEDRRYFYLCSEVMKEMVWQPNHGYNKKNRVEVVSLDELVESVHDGTMHADILASDEKNVADQVEHRLIMEAIKKYRRYLSAEDNQLLTEHYENGMSDRELAMKYNVDHSTITKRRQRILATLLKFFEN